MDAPLFDADDPSLDLNKAVECFALHAGGTRRGAQTLRAWMLDGVRGPDGEVVKLAYVKLGGRIYTSEKRIKAFIAATQQAPAREGVPA